jgi:hypothetical protein
MAVRGRALVRLIEAGRVLLAYHLTADERVRFGLAVEAAQAQLRQLVGEIDPATSAQIIAASETVLGPVGDITMN